jgi:hypothetical protein
MDRCPRSLSLFKMPIVMALCCFAMLVAASESIAGPATPTVNAFYLKTLPEAYSAQEKVFASFKNTGINAVIIELPLTANGYPNIDVVPNIVFFAHQVGVKIHIVLPTRLIPGPLNDHDDWEDRAYDLNGDGYRRTGKLDLFNKAVVEYLAEITRKVASYSVDGILLGADFNYEPLEGMSRAAATFASSKLNANIEPANMYKKMGKGPEGRFIEVYSELFLKWAGVKRDRLVTVFETMKAAARKSNVSLTFGLTVPVVYPMTSSLDMLTRFSFDLDEYRKKGVDYYLAAIDYREMQEKKNFSYRQATEAVSHVCRAMFSLAKDGRRIIIVLPMTERLTAKSLRHSEIEEMYALARSVANMGVGFVIKSDTELDSQFTSRLFKK